MPKGDLAGTTAFTYNAAGQISTLDDPFAASTTKTTYGYEPSTGRLLTRADAQADLTWSRLYEGATGRLDTQTIKKTSNATTLASFDLAYDPAGNVTQKASTVFANPSNTTWSYDYDGASRMTKAVGENATGAATTWDYTYDGGGNRTRAQTTTGSVVADLQTTYNSRGLPTTMTNATTGETTNYTHDAIGNLLLTDSLTVNANDWSQTWEAYGRMTCAKQATTCTSGTARVQFTLDALDRARTRVNAGTTTTYTYTGVGEQVARTVAGSVTTDYASTSSGAPMAQKVGTAVSYHLLDTHSDVVGLVSTAAANQGTTSYDAYGGVLGVTGTQGLLGYQGDITDPTTKQVDMGTRWYAPGQGRFTSRDAMFGEIDSPMSLNQFAYGAMNPVTMSDPTGMMPHCAFDCTPQQQQHLVSTWSQSYGETVQAGTGGSGYSPGTLAQASAQPVQAITYVREASDFAVPVGTSTLLGSLVDSLFNGVQGAGAGANNAADAAFANAAANIGNEYVAVSNSNRGWSLRDSFWGRIGRSRAARWAGRAGFGVSVGLDVLQTLDEGHSPAEAATHGVIVGVAGFAGTALAVTVCTAAWFVCGPLAIGAGIVSGAGGDWVADGLISDEPSCTPINYCWYEQPAPVLA